jgi:hypothetical protein
MIHMIRFKLRSSIVPKYGYIYVNAATIHSVTPSDEGSMVIYGNGTEVYVEHKPSDIVYALANEFTFVRD